MSSEKVLAIIPARGGSKGIPRKNLRMLAGKPLIAHSIEQARHTPAVSRVVVSTDDAEIGTAAQQYGAEVIWRPAEISGDSASSESALLHALDFLRDTENYEPDCVVFLQATSPLREANDIQNAIEILQHENADALFSACPVHGFVWRSAGGNLSSLTYDYRSRQRRQDAPEDLVENGSIYVFKPHILREHNNRLGGKIAVYRMSTLNSFQVDEPGDLELMEGLIAARRPQTAHGVLSEVRLLVLDFDGVMTDNRVLVDQDGRESVLCHRGDGWGIGQVKRAGIDVAVISTEPNPVVSARCRKLHLECIQDCPDKLPVLQALAAERGLEAHHIAYVGNDVNDLDCLKWVGYPIAVADAVREVKAVAQFVTTASGGFGAVREVTDWLLTARQA